MLAPLSCPGSVSQWTFLTWTITHWIAQGFGKPLLVVALLIGLFILAELLPRGVQRRGVRMASSGLLGLYLLLLFPPTVNVAETLLTRPLPPYSGQAADAVVILGRGAELATTRVAIAAELWQDRKAPLIFASGIGDAPRMVKLLQGNGVPAQVIEGEECSRTTYQNAKYTAEVLKPQGIKRILLVTDSPHLLRSMLTFEQFGFGVIPIPSSDLLELHPDQRMVLVLREYLGLASYSLMGRLPLANVLGNNREQMAQHP